MTDLIPAVQLAGIWKRFPGVIANRDINMVVQSGRVHAIVGENGAGKSTLMKILYGMQKPDEGTITINGAPADFSSPSEAIAAGIGMVHQHFMLAENMTVLEKIILGQETNNHRHSFWNNRGNHAPARRKSDCPRVSRDDGGHRIAYA